jgi:hypothetical protein
VRFEAAPSAAIDALLCRVDEELRGLPVLETAAPRFAEILYESFEESTVLHVFVTVPYGRLPSPNQAFVRRLMLGPRGGPVTRQHSGAVARRYSGPPAGRE